MELKPSYKRRVSATSYRPTLFGRQFGIATGHYLASLAASRILDAGGNAIDAGVAASMALAVLQPDIVSFAGVAPTLIYHAKSDQLVSLAGLGWWPAATDVHRLRAVGGKCVPEGVLRQVLPAAPATHIEALKRFGTISFAKAAQPALELARDGFAVFPLLAASLSGDAASYARWPSSAAIFLPGGTAPQVGDRFVQCDLARSIAGMIDAEQAAARRGRSAGLQAAHDYFYKGPIARQIASFHAQEGGFMTADDLSRFEVPVEAPISTTFGGYQIHMGDVWCQGVSLLQAFNILEQAQIGPMAHNSAEYLHLVLESFNLAFADREAYVGDPRFVKVPTTGLLSKAYARGQASRIERSRAFGRMPLPGRPDATVAPWIADSAPVREAAPARDTIYCAVMDAEGNAYSATLSDTSHDVPVIPGTGLVISSRGSQSRLDPGHPAEVQPGKRPRLTPAPALAMSEGRPFMAFGTPGGDVQMQAMLQVFLNATHFGMPLQRAIEEPRAWSVNFPSSFVPHAYVPGGVCAEGNLPAETLARLRDMGHSVDVWPVLPPPGGGVCAVMRDAQTGMLQAGADPRRECYALAW
ncbi:gamma-glutamyltransferase family protein [Variovorax sp. OV329]|uniref:gamma-glutamyltransferase family protein n=1 Tax=Variovorax sp. OV329 TaxID=1882825 RepID=UPI0008EBBFBE|nr:gamma-glutamyltransferase [Variovorax sp. OV329]SFM92353.1 gamma-glutamyltransferase 2. Threonine peptidase. MEROPS family T03 [Variovorax sp. OV329]